MVSRFSICVVLLSLLFQNICFAAEVEGNIGVLHQEDQVVFPSRYGSQKPAASTSTVQEKTVIYLTADKPLEADQPSHKKLIQRNLEFVPAILPVQKNTTVEFINQDDEYHNILSYSKTKRFDLGRYRKEDPAPLVTFDQTGVVKIYCEIHKHMRGIILVLDTPFFVVPDKNGDFRIQDIPAGTYNAVLWRDGKTQEQRITLRQDQTLELSFEA